MLVESENKKTPAGAEAARVFGSGGQAPMHNHTRLNNLGLHQWVKDRVTIACGTG